MVAKRLLRTPGRLLRATAARIRALLARLFRVAALAGATTLLVILLDVLLLGRRARRS